MKKLSIDIETFSTVSLAKSGVYCYAADESFRLLLFGYAIDDGDIHVVDVEQGEQIPFEVLDALTDPTVMKWAFNAAFERVCLSYWLSGGDWMLNPAQWRCTMVWCSYLALPRSLEHAANVLGIEQRKEMIGKKLIKLFCQPTQPSLLTDSTNRNLPAAFPDEWAQFKHYNQIDVAVEMGLQAKLTRMPVPESEWVNYVIDQRINDNGILIDTNMAERAITADRIFRTSALEQAQEITGLANPNSPIQLQAWLKSQGVTMDSMSRQDVADAYATTEGAAKTVLGLRLELAKSSVKKYDAMLACVLPDGRAHGLLAFYGAGRTGRFAGRLIQVQNLPRNTMPDLDLARWSLLNQPYEVFEQLYSPIPETLSQLIRTAFIPSPGCRFIVADYSAIEARVLAWLAGQHDTLQAFKDGKDLYCTTASAMFGVPVEKHGVNGELRQKGKIATLACGYGGSVGALKAMGALRMGITPGELKPIVDAWRKANSQIVNLWWAVDEAVKTCIRTSTPQQVGGLRFTREAGFLFIALPSGRRLAYPKPRLKPDGHGGATITYEGVTATKKWGVIDSYGPKFVENIVQAIARDLLTNALTVITEAGHKIVMHIHDEVVVDEPTTGASVEQIAQLMCQAPAWAEGLPLTADGYECDYYKKD